jgi:hypothetical protein
MQRITTGMLIALGAAAVAAMTGCVADAGGGSGQKSEPVSTSSEPLNGLWIWQWGGTINEWADGFTNGSGLTTDLTIGNGWMCWISEVHGHLGQTGFVELRQSTGQISDIAPYGNWELSIHGDPLHTVQGAAVCAPGSPIATPQPSPVPPVGAPQSFNLVPRSPGVVCGFSAISTWKSAPFVWSDSTSVASIGFNATEWTFTESNANASPSCGVTSASSLWSYHVNPSDGTLPLLQSYPSGPQLPGGTACFLVGIRGGFENDNLNDGVDVDFSNSHWSLSGHGRSASAVCIN